ncbi:MAG: Holliday junction branch migration protein RuvA [Desulfuromonadaceae bacterium]|nr:Holliday junction branch migration protein RuvA [Desulfuromonadaceae bacterium]
MIARLTGQLLFKSPDHLIVDVGGIGYRVLIPLSTFYPLPDTGQVSLFIHTYVREDAIHLYGFLDSFEKELFGLLISVSGVGPRLGVTILSNIPAREFCQGIDREDLKRLSAIPGIGKKTAERLILELKEKIRRLPLPFSPPGTAPAGTAQAGLREDALAALISLGYKENKAQRALESMEIGNGATVETLIRGALKVLSP